LVAVIYADRGKTARAFVKIFWFFWQRSCAWRCPPGSHRLWIKGRGRRRHIRFDGVVAFDRVPARQQARELQALPKQFNDCHGFVSKPAW